MARPRQTCLWGMRALPADVCCVHLRQDLGCGVHSQGQRWRTELSAAVRLGLSSAWVQCLETEMGGFLGAALLEVGLPAPSSTQGNRGSCGRRWGQHLRPLSPHVLPVGRLVFAVGALSQLAHVALVQPRIQSGGRESRGDPLSSGPSQLLKDPSQRLSSGVHPPESGTPRLV